MTAMKNTRTEKNLLAAFADECQASVRYAFFAKQAKREGFEQIAAVFQETSDQERVHARRMHKLMDALEAEVVMPLRSAGVGSTLENLLRAVEGETRAGFETYPAYAATASEEGFTEAALVFENIALAERAHMERYKALAANIERNRVFRRDSPVLWRCRHCGWTRLAQAAPERCPACDHPRAHFEISPSNW
ncbi:MAG: rubrerythrin [Thermodesulfobacteriota bacterium]|jgi:rubrerythrin